MIDPVLVVERFPRQRELIATADALAVGFEDRASEHDRAGSFPHENFAAIRNANLHLLPVPEEYGAFSGMF